MIIFDYNHLYSAYADDTTFFLKDIASIKHTFGTFDFFFVLSVLKSNLTKSEIASISVLKGVQVAVCSMHCIDLNNDTLKILSTHFSYNKKLKEQRTFFMTVTVIQRVLKIWKMRHLALEEKIVIFKTIAISKIPFQSFIATIPKYVEIKFEKLKETFL